MNTVVDERTFNEIYLPSFKAVVQQAGVMAVYSPINGEWNPQNKTTLSSILKEKWGFIGLVMSDWGCTQ
ncbi:Thermostable beta-glucosidase B [compost metagenome]